MIKPVEYLSFFGANEVNVLEPESQHLYNEIKQHNSTQILVIYSQRAQNVKKKIILLCLYPVYHNIIKFLVFIVMHSPHSNENNNKILVYKNP